MGRNKYDPILGEYRQNDSSFWGVSATPPSSTTQGDSYISSVDHTLYFYYGVSWQSTGIVFTPAANVDVTNMDGTTVTNMDGTTVQRTP
jgi:hypothetical protein